MGSGQKVLDKMIPGIQDTIKNNTILVYSSPRYCRRQYFYFTFTKWRLMY
jgi:hypothetical protein